MSFEIMDVMLAEVRPLRAKDRTEATVKVVLREYRDGGFFDHKLTMRVVADTTAAMPPSAVKTALLSKAAVILNRTIARLDVDVPVRAA